MNEFWSEFGRSFNDFAVTALEAVVVAGFGFVCVRLIKRMLWRALIATKVNGMLLGLVLRVTEIALYVLIAAGVLALFGVSLTGIVVVASAVGLSLSLAIQDWLGNFASGLSLATTKPFSVGDYVSVGGTEGYVREIKFMNTVIDTLDNKRAVLPNKSVFTSNIINYSANDTRMLELYFGVDYDTDIDDAQRVIQSVVAECDKTLKFPPPLVRLYALDESALKFRVRVWVRNEDYFEVLYRLNEGVLSAFRKEGITVPFKQIQVGFRSGHGDGAGAVNGLASKKSAALLVEGAAREGDGVAHGNTSRTRGGKD